MPGTLLSISYERSHLMTTKAITSEVAVFVIASTLQVNQGMKSITTA